VIKGRIHSYESCGTVDGPGLRFVLFMQGCPLRCLYCHNPDSWKMSDGKEVEVDEVVEEIKKYRSYMRFSGGGLTISGGEPLMQPKFVREVLQKCREENIHTAIDTSGIIDPEKVADVYDAVDMVLLDIKVFDEAIHKELVAQPWEMPLKTARYLAKIGKRVWLRHVLVPGITAKPELLHKLAQFAAELDNVEHVEILPFHKMGEYKWQEMGFKYQLGDTPSASRDEVEEAIGIFESYGLDVQAVE